MLLILILAACLSSNAHEGKQNLDMRFLCAFSCRLPKGHFIKVDKENEQQQQGARSKGTFPLSSNDLLFLMRALIKYVNLPPRSTMS